jgi:hypothetical protein
VNARKPATKLVLKDLQDDEGACSQFGCHVIVGVFEGGHPTLVHELVHAVEHAAEFIPLPRGFDHNEPTAYLMQHMFRLCAPHVVTE